MNIDYHHVVEAAGVLTVGILLYSYSHLWLADGSRYARLRPVFNGLVFAGVTIWLMWARIQVAENVFVDARAIPIALIALFEGPVAAIAAVVPPVLWRASRGGSGAWAGMGALVLVAALGVLVHAWSRRDGGVRWHHSAILGIGVFLVTFASFAVLGLPGFQKFAAVWSAYVALYCIGVAVIARLFRDVGDRARLATEQARFRAILDEATDAIRIVDPETRRILDVNLADCRLSGYDRDDMIGRDLREFVPPEPALRAEHEALDAEVRTHGVGQRLGLSCVDRTGRLVRLDVTRRRVRHDGRQYDIVVARDAAPREAFEAAAHEATQLRTATVIAATAAHEINNPLSVVIGSLDLLVREVPEGGRARLLIDRAAGAGVRITDIVARLKQIRRFTEVPVRPNLPQILDLKRSTDPSPDERTGDAQWKRSSTRSSS